MVKKVKLQKKDANVQEKQLCPSIFLQFILK